MGRKKHFVGNSIDRIFKDEDLPETVKNSVIESVLLNRSIGGNLSDAIRLGYLSSINKSRNYAKNGYVFGLPEYTETNNTQGKAEVLAYLKGIHGITVNILYHQYTQLNLIHQVYKRLNEEFGYRPDTNSMKVGEVVQEIENVVVYIYTGQIFDEEGVPSSSFSESNDQYYIFDETPSERLVTIDPNAEEGNSPYGVVEEENTDTYAKIYVIYEGEGEPVREITIMDLANESEGELTLHTSYTYLDADSQLQYGYFTYIPTTETIPELSNVEAFAGVNPRESFPFLFLGERRAYFQIIYAEPPGEEYLITDQQGEPELDDQGNPQYRDSDYKFDVQNRWFDKEEFPEEPTESNTYQVAFGVDRFETFNEENDGDIYKDSAQLAEYMGIDYAGMTASLSENRDADKLQQGFVMSGVNIEGKTDHEVAYLYEYFSRLARNNPFGTTNDGTNLFNPRFASITYEENNFGYSLGMRGITSTLEVGVIGIRNTYEVEESTLDYVIEGFDENDSPAQINYTAKTYIFRKQISTTQYREVTVIDPEARYIIFQGNSVYSNGDDEKLLVPMDDVIARALPGPTRELVYLASLHTVFNSRVTRKVKFYETSLFRFIIIVIAVVIAVISYGTLAKASYTLLTVTYALTAAVAVLLTIAFLVVYTLGLQLVFKLAVDLIGVEAAVILGIIAVIAGYTAGLEGIYAQIVPTIGAGLISASTAEFNALTNEYIEKNRDFDLLARERLDELQEIEESLKVDIKLDIYKDLGLVPLIIQGERAQTYFDRMLKVTEFNNILYDYNEQFVDNALKLPSTDKPFSGMLV